MARLTKYNPETNQYEFNGKAKTQAEFNEQRKAVIQKLGEYEDKASEVEKLEKKVEELSEILSDTIRIRYAEAKREVAEEIFGEIEQLYMEEHKDCSVILSRYEFAELKKKYTEGGENGK